MSDSADTATGTDTETLLAMASNTPTVTVPSQANLSQVANPAPTTSPFKKTLSTEIWLRIWSYVRTPRVLTITYSDKKYLYLHPSIERIPGGTVMTARAEIETMKTHSVTFGDWLWRSVLFNPDTDVIMLDRISFEAVGQRHGIPHPSQSPVSPQVRFAAIHLDSLPGATTWSGDFKSWVERGSFISWVLSFIRFFVPKVEKLFLVRRNDSGDKEKLKSEVEYQLRTAHRLFDAARKNARLRTQFHGYAAVMTSVLRESPWNMPETVVVDKESDILTLLESV